MCVCVLSRFVCRSFLLSEVIGEIPLSKMTFFFYKYIKRRDVSWMPKVVGKYTLF